MTGGVDKVQALSDMLLLSAPETEVFRQMTTDNLDSVFYHCSRANARALRIVRWGATTGSISENRLTLLAGVAPLMALVTPDEFGNGRAINGELHSLAVHMNRRVNEGRTPHETEGLDSLISIARGAYLALKIMVEETDDFTDDDLLWIDQNHVEVTGILPELIKRHICDPALVREMVSVSLPLSSGAL